MNNNPFPELDILFYAERGLHLPFLEPVHDYLKTAYPDLRLGFSAPPLTPSTSDLPGCGLSEAETARIQRKTMYFEDSASITSKLAVVADVCHFRIPHIPRVVNLGHGLICKGHYYCRTSVTRRENLSELVCVPGPWHKRRLEQNVFVPIEVTGFIKSDLFFGSKRMDSGKFRQDMGIDPENNIILFAPTFNEELSAIPVIQDQLAHLAGQENTVLIKLHQATADHWKRMYQELARKNQNIVYLTEGDYAPMMHAADVMISDVSSIFVEFMLLDKPVVLFKNPKITDFPGFNANNIEYRVRDAVQEAETFSQLQAQVEKALAAPDALSSLRTKYIEELDFGRDGQSAQRAGQAIVDRLMHKNRSKTQLGRFSIFLFIEDDVDLQILEASFDQLSRESLKFPMEVLPVGGSRIDYPWPRTGFPVLAGDGELLGFSRALERARGNMGVLLKPGWSMPQGWIKWLSNHFQWNDNTGMVKATSDINLIRPLIGEILPGGNPPIIAKALASILLTLGIGNASLNDGLASPCSMIPMPVLQACISTGSGIHQDDIAPGIELIITSAGLQSLSALDTFAYPMQETFIVWDQQALMNIVDFLKNQGMPELAVQYIERYGTG
ncbi:CDP-glycerol glycerophosphotransferase family protein [Desulfonatronovibrio hydrogenovorans]|uniref:CDP-glycerol glycerophosphotransferase family protein n=1 Tax=Desulfonatronovibrio hydrogenovorans TaxID=53245 RepID=UPI00048E4681|nr:CDP-glycerol glycerophosphotransferase family protein [Desulfonatronovibrio hydrogenovorans]